VAVRRSIEYLYFVSNAVLAYSFVLRHLQLRQALNRPSQDKFN